jgi:hypothetical protein
LGTDFSYCSKAAAVRYTRALPNTFEIAALAEQHTLTPGWSALVVQKPVTLASPCQVQSFRRQLVILPFYPRYVALRTPQVLSVLFQFRHAIPGNERINIKNNEKTKNKKRKHNKQKQILHQSCTGKKT